ncbi:MAG: DUF1684 domain-containing protein [Armatimonadetes bacterium]|nr:DUF1684 domain-containing protein [Armatimonadota bacterium]
MSLIAYSTALILAMSNPKDYKAEIEKWRHDANAQLLTPEGWLSVAGLFWLQEGDNSLGTKADEAVTLPHYSSPIAQVGTLTRTGKKVTLKVADGADVKVDGKTGSTFDLKSDNDQDTSTVSVGPVTFKIIVRGERVGVRLFDSQCKAVKEFKGRKWYPVKPEFKIEAKFVPYTPAMTVQILNVLGDSSPAKVSGYVEFPMHGKTVRLDAIDEGGEMLFFNFRDATSGKQTYDAGRFLYSGPPKDGKVTLDFNRAVNPPCAFTSYATCPLPPKSNILDVPIEAGELKHHPTH